MEELSEILKKLDTGNTSKDNKISNIDKNISTEIRCENCSDKGWITTELPIDHPSFGKPFICDCQQAQINFERTKRLLKYSNLGYLHKFNFKNTNPKGINSKEENPDDFSQAYKDSIEFTKSPNGWLVFTGPSGSGKTHLAAAIGNKCIEDGKIVFFTRVPDLLDHLRSTFNPNSDLGYSDIFEQINSAEVLILDELGSHNTSPWAEEKLRQVIGHRFNAELPTIFTINGKLNNIDEQILSRLQSINISKIYSLKTDAQHNKFDLGFIEPKLLYNMTFEKFNTKGNFATKQQKYTIESAYKACEIYAENPEGWLTLYGETGVGKTHLAISISNRRIELGDSPFFTFVPELLDYLRQAFDPKSEISYEDRFDAVKKTPLLILDDLGKERSSQWAVEKLYQIIVYRHNAQLPTIITSMLEFEDILDPITSRVQDPAVSQIIKIRAPDYRNKSRSGIKK